jgi:lipopolysaccharide biosynthesis glycosyltransferase
MAQPDKQERLDLLFTADNNFVMQMGISILSALESNYLYYHIIYIHIVSLGIFDKGLRDLESLFVKDYQDCRIHLVYHDSKDFAHLVNPKTQSPLGYSVYLRLLVQTLTDADVERIIYIDSDCLVIDSLVELTRLNLDGFCLGAVIDLQVSEKRKRRLGLSCQNDYINAGVLVYNMQEVRRRNAEEQLIGFVNTTDLALEYHDQDAINVVLKDAIRTIHPRYNAVTTFFFMNHSNYKVFVKSHSFGDKDYYPTKIFLEAQRNPAILHFFGSNIYGRPWLDFCHHPYRKAYLHIKEISPWKEAPLVKSNLSPFARTFAFFARIGLKILPAFILDALSRVGKLG